MSRHTSADTNLSGDLLWIPDGRIQSEAFARVTYVLDRLIGRGGFASACLATRLAPDGSLPVVLKVMRPAVAAQSLDLVTRLFKKEVVALGRLNERVPPSPFVVRLLDSGTLAQSEDGCRVEIPWLAIEYVHGGVEGETLRKRVRYSVENTGFAFEPDRAARMLRQLASGLTEIHAAEIIHRDFKPSNVLTCGFGGSEVAKISDFGIARPTGLASTFGKLSLGTPGYVAPEQMHLREEIGPWTDVFSLAGVVYYMLSGEKLFDVTSPIDGVLAATAAARKSLLDARGLSPTLRDSPAACRALDDALKRASAADPRARFASAEEFASAILPWLRQEEGAVTSRRHAVSVISMRDLPIAGRDPSAWKWSARRLPGGDSVVVDTAWSADGHCIAPTQSGLSYWDGSAWTELRPAPISPIHMVRPLGPGRWLLSGDAARLFELVADEAREILAAPDPTLTITQLDGDLADLAAMVAVAPSRPPLLIAICGQHWLKPLAVEFAASVPALVRLDAERWLAAGRAAQGGAFAATYRPLDWRLEIIAQPPAPALVAASSQPEASLAIAVGGTSVVIVDRDGTRETTVPADTSWSACGVDVLGGCWVAGAGQVWFAPKSDAPWRRAWRDPSWSAPFVSLFADAGRVIAVTADGGVLEGSAMS